MCFFSLNFTLVKHVNELVIVPKIKQANVETLAFLASCKKVLSINSQLDRNILAYSPVSEYCVNIS